MSRSDRPTGFRSLTVEFLYLDRTRCTRCRETNDNLDAGLAAVAAELRRTGVDVAVRKIHVQTEEQARALRFVSSPTVRVNGQDVALEMKESPCSDCGCGCDEDVLCRVWVYRGTEYTAAPTELIVEAIRRAAGSVGDTAAAPDTRPFEVPDNLKRYFAAKDSAACCG